MKKREDIITIIGVIILIMVGFLFRTKGLFANYSFWTDEGHVAIFSREILKTGKPVLPNGYSTGSYQFILYYLVAFSMKIFGTNEFAARFPTIIFGSLTIPAVFLAAKEFFNKKIAIISSILLTFLSIEILWSRQVRPYQAIQFFYLIEILLFSKFIKAFDKKTNYLFPLIGFILCILISSLMHWFGLMPIIFFSSYLLFIRFDIIKLFFNFIKLKFFKKSVIGFISIFFLTGLIITLLKFLGFFYALSHFITPAFDRIEFYNQFGYYHTFLKQYFFIVFLAIIGLVVAITKNWKKNSIFLFIIVILFCFVNFRLRVPFTRYLYPIFPLIIILFSLGLELISNSLSKIFNNKISSFVILIILTLIIVVNGDKFSVRPRNFYSLNSDMQEIPEVDFKGLYQRLENIGGQKKGWVLINTWPDHATWYLGEGKPEYWLRRTDVVYGEKNDLVSGALIIDNSSEIKEIITNHSRGFIIIESWDSFTPIEPVEFIQKNLKKEFEIDRLYEVQPRYWPVTVYSWGFD